MKVFTENNIIIYRNNKPYLSPCILYFVLLIAHINLLLIMISCICYKSCVSSLFILTIYCHDTELELEKCVEAQHATTC